MGVYCERRVESKRVQQVDHVVQLDRPVTKNKCCKNKRWLTTTTKSASTGEVHGS